MEYCILQRAMNHHDFFEGARAGMSLEINLIIHFFFSFQVFIDKDNQPRWEPNSLETVSDEYIVQCFDRLPADKELRIL
jgi:hypothetical protein